MTKATLKSRKQFLKKLPSFFFKKSRLSGQSTSLLAQQQSTLLSSGTENALFLFLGRNLKNLYFSTPFNFSRCKFYSKNINSLYLGLKCFILVFLENTFKNLLEFVRFQSLILNKNKLNLVQEIAFCVNLEELLKKLLSFLQSAPSNLSNVKFRVKQEHFELGNKNALFEYFSKMI